MALLQFSGCSSRLGDFSILSNRNVVLDGEHSLVERNVKGSDGVWVVLLLIPITEANLEDALDKILIKYKADFLTNVVIRRTFWIGIVVSWEGFVITGDAWRNGSAPSGALFAPEEIVHRGRKYELLPLPIKDAFRIVEKL